jgi:peptidoglycan/LPS O-acetylase OafA/YrhL
MDKMSCHVLAGTTEEAEMAESSFGSAPYGQSLATAPRMLPRLTGIRAVAALSVVAYHYGDTVSMLFPWFWKLQPVYKAGGIGVDLFFTLSGFILCHNYLRKFSTVSLSSYLKFLGARLARVYPVHLITLLFLTVIVLMAAHAGKPMNSIHYGMARWIENLLLTQAWPGLGNVLSWNYPAWSVSAEWFAYLLFPLLAVGIGRAPRPILFCVVSIGVYAIPVTLGWIPEGALLNWSVLRATSEFLFGSFLYRLYERGDRCPLSPSLAGILVVVLTLLCSYFKLHPTWVVPAYGILIWSLADRPKGPLDGRVAVYLGEISYSLYMTHGALQLLFNRVEPPKLFFTASVAMRLALLSTYAVLVALSAVATYHLVEVPGRRAMLALFGTKHAIVPPEGGQPQADTSANLIKREKVLATKPVDGRV